MLQGCLTLRTLQGYDLAQLERGYYRQRLKIAKPCLTYLTNTL